MAQLVSKSLVRIAEDAADEPRFWLLATIRDYAIDQLARSDELVEARSRHAAYYVELAEKLQHSLRGSGMAVTLNELSQAYGNFRTVFQWASEVDDLATGLRLAGALNRFWMARGPLTEARSWLESALPRSAAIAPSIRAAALSTAGVLAGIQHDHEQAIAYFQESLVLWELLGDVSLQARSHLNLGLVAYITGQVDEAERQFERGHDLYLAVGDRSGQSRAIGHRARLAQEQHDLLRAKRLLEESFELSQAADDQWGVAHSLANLGQLSLALDDRPGATAAFRQALEVWRKLGNFVDIAECFEGMAAAMAGAQPRRAANLLGAAEVLRERSGAPAAAVELRRYEDLVARLHKQLREDTFAAAWHQGRRLAMDRAIDLAMRDDDHRAHTDPAGVLSPREHEIAEMIARGQSNQGIADNLVVSIKTVESHVQHIFRKLSVKRRAEIATWIVRHEMLDNPT
jgi:non-specific serine/threonine protein kinase